MHKRFPAARYALSAEASGLHASSRVKPMPWFVGRRSELQLSQLIEPSGQEVLGRGTRIA